MAKGLPLCGRRFPLIPLKNRFYFNSLNQLKLLLGIVPKIHNLPMNLRL